MKNLIALLVGLSLIPAGVAGSSDPAVIGPAPENYKEVIKEYMLRTLLDPYSIRNASITEPFPDPLPFTKGWAVCVEMNAKNGYGAYAGLQRVGYEFERGKIVDSATHSPSGFCYSKNLVFSPWPDIEQMK